MANDTVENEILRGNSKTLHNDVEALPGLTQIPTSVTLSADKFEKLYLSPMAKRQPALTKKLGNPTPLYAFLSCFLSGLGLWINDYMILGHLGLMCSQLHHSRVA